MEEDRFERKLVLNGFKRVDGGFKSISTIYVEIGASLVVVNGIQKDIPHVYAMTHNGYVVGYLYPEQIKEIRTNFLGNLHIRSEDFRDEITDPEELSKDFVELFRGDESG